MWTAENWKDYELIDASSGERLERWGNQILIRPDPQVIWKTPKEKPQWKKWNGHYHRSAKGGGEWDIRHLPENGRSATEISPSIFSPLPSSTPVSSPCRPSTGTGFLP